MSLKEMFILINKANELQRQIHFLKNKISRNNRYETRSFNDSQDYFNTPNQVGTGKMYMLNPKSKSEISLEIRKKPYSRNRKQLNPERGISKEAESNSIIKMPSFTKAIDINLPDTEYLLTLYNTNLGLIEMTADEVAETIRFCEQKITQEQLEESIMYVLPELNLEEAKHFLKIVDWMKF